MFLSLDIGNTRIKYGMFNAEGLLLENGILPDFEEQALSVFVSKNNIQAAIVSSVASTGEAGKIFLKNNLPYFLELTHETPLPIKNQYATPQTLGKDRLAGVVGAAKEFPGQHNLVIDAGTCIKYDFITELGEYKGGSILPGLAMRFEALHHYTARLPLVEMKPLENFIGDSTETAIRTGVQLGVLYEVEGFIAQYRQVFGNINVILTGGDADYFVSALKIPIFAAPELILTGLFQILHHNVHTIR